MSGQDGALREGVITMGNEGVGAQEGADADPVVATEPFVIYCDAAPGEPEEVGRVPAEASPGSEPTPQVSSVDATASTGGEDCSWDDLIERIKAGDRGLQELARQRAERRLQEAEAQAQRQAERDKAAREAQEREEAFWAKARAECAEYESELARNARACDLDSVLAKLDYSLKDPGESFPKEMSLIQATLDVAARTNPQKLYAFLGARMAAWAGFLMIRSHYVAMNLIRAQDRDGRTPCGQLPKEVVEVWLPRIQRIEASIQQSAAAFARVTHTMNLGSKKKRGRKAGVKHGHDEHAAEPGESPDDHEQGGPTDHPPRADGDAGAVRADPGTPGGAAVAA